MALTKSAKQNNMMVMATMNPILGVTTDDNKKKPAIMKFYDYTKGGTDIVGQIVLRRTVKPKSKRWVVAAFSWILDAAIVNSMTIKYLNTNKDPCEKKMVKRLKMHTSLPWSWRYLG